jgi:nicotinamide riboside transporter PnuC
MKIENQDPNFPMRGTIRDVLRSTSSSLCLARLMLLLPSLLVGWFAWHHYQAVMKEAEEMAQRSVAALQEHATNVLDTHFLVLLHIAAMTQNRSWNNIANDTKLQQHIANLASNFPQIAMIGLADANGQLRISSESLSPSYS